MDMHVVLSMMMKLPERRMAAIKKDFGRSGLSLESFVKVMVKHLSVEPNDTYATLRRRRSYDVIDKIELVSDLKDFFDQVKQKSWQWRRKGNRQKRRFYHQRL